MSEKNTVTIKLSRPIVVGGKEVKELTMREPFAKDMRRTFTKKNLDKYSQQQLMMQLGAELCGLSDDEFDLLSMGDVATVLEAVDRFA